MSCQALTQHLLTYHGRLLSDDYFTMAGRGFVTLTNYHQWLHDHLTTGSPLEFILIEHEHEGLKQ